ncbi:MAG: LegC family aminotransferase [Desulfobacterales bacterium]|nr:LegC family aminotransferase [Desulfobacterales bacterium]
MSKLSGEILTRLQNMFPKGAALHEPLFEGNEWQYVKECINTSWVSSRGVFVDRLEQGLISFTGAKYAVAVINGTSALHLALMIAGVERDDEVLVPSLTFAASANAVSYCGAVPHFTEICRKTLGVDPHKLDSYLSEIAEIGRNGFARNKTTGRQIKACIPMHTFGHPVDMESLNRVCQKWNIVIVEDAAESLGSFYKNRHTGLFGQLGVFSFNGNKIITAGGGGAVVTDSEQLAARARHLSTTAKVSHDWEFIHDEIGYNYRLPGINAALACAQLEQLPFYIAQKRKLALTYQDVFQDLEGVSVFFEPDGCASNYWLNVMLLDPEKAKYRQEILISTNANKIMTRPAWKLLPDLKIYEMCPKMTLDVSQELYNRIICLPSSVKLQKS